MCMMLLKPKGIVMPDGWLEKAHSLNSDGYGIASTTSRYERLICYVNPKLVSWKDNLELWHFRYALSGRDDPKSTQPFISPDHRLAFAHVGVLKDWPLGEHSDSYEFWQDIKDFIQNPGIGRLINAYCNVTQNRMVLLDYHGKYMIFGGQNGFWTQGLWLSGVLE